MQGYTKVGWKDGETGGTPVSSTNLNHMDDGIENVTEALVELKGAITFNASTSALTIDLDKFSQ